MSVYRLLLQGSASHLPLRDESVQCVVTSPPYWGLRQYAGEQREVWGGDPEHAHEWGDIERKAGGGQTEGVRWQHTGGGPSGHPAVASGLCCCGAWYGALGLEPTPDLYVEHIVTIFREVRRVLRPDGTLWLNLGDSYAANRSYQVTDSKHVDVGNNGGSHVPDGLKPKDLVGIPWMVAFALRADGWYLRSDIIWVKPNPMPESVTDRPTKAHEYLFLLSKSERYYYDGKAIEEPLTSSSIMRLQQPTFDQQTGGPKDYGPDSNRSARRALVNLKGRAMPPQVSASPDQYAALTGRNKRTVWTIATQPYAGAHFATFPEALVEPCILAGSRPGDTILDPFNGSGTTGRVAIRHGRSYVGIDISREYLAEQATKRTTDIQHTMLESTP